MIRLVRAALLILSVSSLAAGAVAAADVHSSDGLRDAAIIVSDQTFDTFMQARSAAEGAGARGLQMFPPEAIFGRFPASALPSAFQGLPVVICASRDELSGKGLSTVVERVVGDLFSRRELLSAAPQPVEAQVPDRLLTVPEEVVRATTPSGPRRGSPSEILDRGINQNSEFLIGSVLINLIFPESIGSDENWTDQELANALAAISLGLSEYQQHAQWVNLSFTLNYKRFVQVPVFFEPIEGDMSTDYIWISQALDTLGLGKDIFAGALKLNNTTRKTYKTDWVFTSFVVNMANHYTPNPPHPDPGCWGGAGYVAYSYLGGPFTVVPYPACRYGYGLGFGQVFIHEMSHIFWALDEYVGQGPAGPTGTPCPTQSGYLAVSNGNTLFDSCRTTVPCIMQSGLKSSPLPVCDYTMGQVGLADADDNSVPDIYQVAPTVEFETQHAVSIDTIFAGDDCFVSVVMYNNGIPNKNPQEPPGSRVNYAPTLAGGEISIDEEPFVAFAPLDGKWDGSRENKVFTITNLQPGVNTVTVHVRNCVDLEAYAKRNIYFIGIKYYFLSADVSSGSIEADWTTSGEVFGASFDVVRSDFTSGERDKLLGTVTVPDNVTTKRRTYHFTDNTVMAGHEYTYRIVGKFSITFRGQTRSMKFSSQNVARTSIIPVTGLVSPLIPNPTSRHTSFTIDVPKSWHDWSATSEPPLGGGASRAPLSSEVRTAVDVSVYDASGRKIRAIYSNERYGGLMTLSWDGTNEAGKLVPSGVYFLSVHAGGKKEVKKVVLIR